jgi:hydrogenase-4 component B
MSIFEHLSSFSLWLGAAFFLWIIVFVSGFIQRKNSGPVFSIVVMIGSVFLLIAVFLSGRGNQSILIPLPWFLGDAGIDFSIDPLSRWFLAIIGVIGIPVSLFSPGYLYHLRNRVSLGLVWSGFSLLMISMCGVVMSSNAIVFIVFWEIMALSSFALVAADNEHRETRRAAFIYLGATRIGTGFLMGGFLWAHSITGSWDFSHWGISGAAAIGPALLIFIGLATKAGCWPFHLWLPIAHPAAPAPVSAIMSGVMIKTAIYAMIRFFIVGSHINYPALAYIILILGAISAFWGVIFALLQHDLKRLLAYHSVENIGIIMMGIGISALGSTLKMPFLIQLGLAAALFHTLNHAVFKSLLFLGAGAIDARTHLRNIEKMGGLIHKMPWTAGAFIVGSAAICALPPLNGFASEWLLYQGFFKLALNAPTLGARLSGLLLMGILALIGALAIACFVKAVSVVFLGVPRSSQAQRAKEGNRSMSIAQVFLAMLCIGLGLAVPLLISPLSSVASLTGSRTLIENVWTIPVGMLALLLAGTVICIVMWMQRLSKSNPARNYITWDCGFGELGPKTQYTATSFAQPISRIFGSIYHYALKVTTYGRQRRHFPETVEAETQYEAYLETKFYEPFLRGIQRISGIFLMRLQAGSIHQYLIYMAFALALLIWVGVSK